MFKECPGSGYDAFDENICFCIKSLAPSTVPPFDNITCDVWNVGNQAYFGDAG